MITIFKNQVLGSAYAVGDPVYIENNLISLACTAVVTVAATIQWYIEFSDNPFETPTPLWFRELSEEVTTGGVVVNALAIRSFAANGGGTLGAGTHLMSVQLTRVAPFYRISARVSAGAASLRGQATTGQIAQAP